MGNQKINIIKGFNLLRFLASLGVLVFHLELYKKKNNHYSLYDTVFKRCINGLGPNMVYLFFVLSGFLITYLLLIELKKTNTINVKKFYIRRALRIWPLYYLIMFISFFIFPSLVIGNSFFIEESFYNRIINTDYRSAFPLFLFLFSNMALLYGYRVAGAAQSWSVSVEEQFYAFWPWVIKIFHKKLSFFLVAFIFLKIYLSSFSHGFEKEYIKIIIRFVKNYPVDYMAIGALSGYYAFKGCIYINLVFKNKIIISLVVFLIGVLLFMNVKGIYLPVLFAALLGIMFFNQDKIHETKLSEYGGGISYGIYMYHPLVMFLVSASLNNLFNTREHNVLYNVFFYSFTILITIFISHVSFKYFESYFLNKKGKYSVVKTKSKF